MTEQETITVAEVSDGRASVGTPGASVALPVVELLTGRGFVTGKSGSGKSNTASVVVENLLDLGFPVLIVDIDGEYYGLKEKYEILHVGADEECDIQVSEEHAEKVADLALHQNVPIILDVSSFLDESAAAALLTEVTRHLFAKEKKLKKPFLIVVEEIHEYLPEGGGLDECGRMLIKVGKRGRKHGLGVCGISQRPADVKKDFITQCDWLCWHRLTWRNDTKVVKRVLGNEYADAVEGLDDGEAFLATDWSDDVRRVQFHRKRTFDAGATPGLDDFQRPDLKSVSDDLVNELSAITEEDQRRADEIDRLRAALREKERRIEMLETDLENARDLRHLADQFAAALFDHPGRSRMQLQGEDAGADDRQRARDARNGFPAVNAWSPAAAADGDAESRPADPAGTADGRPDTADPAATAADPATPRPEARAANGNRPDEGATATARGDTGGAPTDSAPPPGAEAGSGPIAAPPDRSGRSGDGRTEDGRSGDGRSGDGRTGGDAFEDLFTDSTPWPSWRDGDDAARPSDGSTAAGSPANDNGNGSGDDGFAFDLLGQDATSEQSVERSAEEPSSGVLVSGESGDSRERSNDGGGQSSPDGPFGGLADDRRRSTESSNGLSSSPGERDVVRQVRRVLESADAVTLGMLVRYRRLGPLAPEDAHVAAGGDGDRTRAYSRNSTLRQAGLVKHAGRGRYEYALRDLVERTHDDRLSSGRVDAVVEQIEQELLLSPLDT